MLPAGTSCRSQDPAPRAGVSREPDPRRTGTDWVCVRVCVHSTFSSPSPTKAIADMVAVVWLREFFDG